MRWIRPARAVRACSTSSRETVTQAASRARRPRHLEAHREDGQRARVALDVDVAAHRERQLLHDREAEAGADLPLPPVALVQVEALERALGVVLGEARAPCPRRAARRARRRRAPRRRAASAAARSRRDSRRPGGRGRRRRPPARDLGDRAERHAEAVRLLLVAADGVLGHLGEVDLGVVDAEVGAVHAREVEQVAGRAARAAAPRRRRSPPPRAGRARRPRPPRRSRGSR